MRYLLPILLILAGCATPTKYLHKHDKIEAKARKISDTVGLHWCNVNFPNKERIITKTITKQGRPIITTERDTITVNCDTIRTIVRIPCPPAKYRVDTVVVTDSIITVDSRSFEIERVKVAGLTKSNEELTDRLKSQRKGLILGWLIVGVLVALYVIKRR